MTAFEAGSGNVFADAGVKNPELALAKAQLALCISKEVEKRGLKQAEAAELLKIDQAKVSALLCGRLSGFSTERLIRFLNAFNQDVEIVVKPKPRGREHARLHVTAL